MRSLLLFTLLIAVTLGCKKQDEGQQSIKVYIPNAFRPDDMNGAQSLSPCPGGDMECNRSFKVGISNPDSVDFEADMAIYNSRGLKVFHSHSLAEGWNGREQQIGDYLPQGIYRYMFHIRQLNNGSVRIYKGEVLLLR